MEKGMNKTEQESYVLNTAIERDQENYWSGRINSTVAACAFGALGLFHAAYADYGPAGVSGVISIGAFCLRKYFQSKVNAATAPDYQPTAASVAVVRQHNEKIFATYDHLIAQHS
jgi:hypothetical protein